MASASSGGNDLAYRVAERPATEPATGLRSVIDRYFYFLMSVLMAGVVVYGFSRTAGDKLIHPAIPRPSILYVHAIVFSGWMAFFIFQTIMVRTRHVGWHRIAGRFGVALGAGVFVIGIATAVTMARFNIANFHARYAALSLLISFYDMAAFGVPFALAVYWRTQPERHRRLMLVATCALMSAAFGRFPIPPHVRASVFFYAAVDGLIVVAMARDWLVIGRPHRVYVASLAAFVFCQIAVVHAIYHHSPTWLRIAHAVLN